jgi:hypothetical protein
MSRECAADRVTGGNNLRERVFELTQRGVALTEAPDGCRGLCATRAFARGEGIFSEVPVAWLGKSAQQAIAFAAKVELAKEGRQHDGRAHARARAAPRELDAAWAEELGLVLSPGASTAALEALQPVQAGPMTLRRLAAVLATNAAGAAFSVEDDSGNGLTALLLAFSMMNHSCAPSVGWTSSFEDNAVVFRVFANRDVAEGEALEIAYSPLAAQGHVRRIDLRHRYGFDCVCARCSASGDDTRVFRCCGCGAAVHLPSMHTGQRACASCGGDWVAVLGPPDCLPQYLADEVRSAGDGRADALSALHADLLWWLDAEPGEQSRAASSRLLHASDVALTREHSRLAAQLLEAACARPHSDAADTAYAAAEAAAEGLVAGSSWRHPAEGVDAWLCAADCAVLAERPADAVRWYRIALDDSRTFESSVFDSGWVAEVASCLACAEEGRADAAWVHAAGGRRRDALAAILARRAAGFAWSSEATWTPTRGPHKFVGPPPSELMLESQR